MQRYVEFADLEVAVLIILHTSVVEEGKKIYLIRPACVIASRKLETLINATYSSTVQHSTVGSGP